VTPIKTAEIILLIAVPQDAVPFMYCYIYMPAHSESQLSLPQNEIHPMYFQGDSRSPSRICFYLILDRRRRLP